MCTYITNTGVPSVAPVEFICDHDTVSVGYHNFKVGTDGIIRAVYNNVKSAGKGDTLFYSQRTPLFLGTTEANAANKFSFYPNPAHDFLIIHGAYGPGLSVVKVFTLLGEKVLEEQLTGDRVNLESLDNGTYLIELSNSDHRFFGKLFKE